MSKGSRVVTLRLPPDLERVVESELKLHQTHSNQELMGMSDFLRMLVVRGLQHRQRSRRRKQHRAE